MLSAYRASRDLAQLWAQRKLNSDMKLAIFDIDGTLTQTSAVDAHCFARALTRFGLPSDEAEWYTCPHVSDTGLLRHLYQTQHARDPHEHEETALRDHFVTLLHEQQAQDETLFAEVFGASVMLSQLARKADWLIAVATGCWHASATMKLQAAKLSLLDKPGGFAEDGPARETIVSAALQRATAHYSRSRFEKVVSIGDGVWDVRTAANLGLPFVGIAADSRAEALRQQGAQHIVPDYADCDQFFHYLEQAEAPRNSLIATT